MNAGDLLDNLIDALQHIPEIVEEMDGDASRISAYHDAYPTLTSFELVVDNAPSPSITGVWMASGPARIGDREVCEHRFSLFLRSRRVPAGSSATRVGYYRIFDALRNGVPSNGNGLALLEYQIHPECLPMDFPRMERERDAEGVSYWEVPISFKEL